MNKETTSKKQGYKPKGNDRKHNGLDDAYITAYCDNPQDGKTANLLKAGFAGKNAKQEAYRMHKRLQQQIYDRTTELISTLDSLAAKQLTAILKEPVEKVGYSNMKGYIQQGMDYAGRKQADTLVVKQETINDIDTEITRLQKEIANEEGVTIQ